MARKLRVEYPGAAYHVINRGDRRKAIFRDEEDRQQFLGTLGKACAKTGWQVHALCLMPNHFHLVVETAVTVKWIAERLQMGAPGYVNHLLYPRRRAGGK
jgi:REP element-mobilizing transposase RayT